jgi:hypothetical protein
MFYGKFETWRYFDNMVIMIGWEDERFLKLKGTSTQEHKFSYLSPRDEGALSSSLLWHAKFGHINYDSIHMLKKNGVSSFPTILNNLKQCDAYIIGKHNKQPFHDSTLRACRKLELIHSDLCGPMFILFVFGNGYIMNFIYDYTRMCWLYLLK